MNNLGTVTITKKRMIRIPDDVINKLKINTKTDAVSFIFENDEIKIRVLKG